MSTDPKFGSSLRASAVGQLEIFGEGSFAHPDTDRDQQGTTYPAYLEHQFAQPASKPGRGLLSMQAAQSTKESVEAAFRGSLQRFIFKDAQLASLNSMPERLMAMASEPVPAMMVVARFPTGSAADGTVTIGPSSLMIWQAPSVPPRAEATSSEALWPSTTSLLPGHWPPPSQGPIFLCGASVAAQTRLSKNATSMGASRADYLKDMVLTTQADRLATVGWTTSTIPASPGMESFYLDGLRSVQGPHAPPYLGAGDPPTSMPANSSVVLLPLALPLSAFHGIPAGQLYAPSIGSRDFIASIRSDIDASAPTADAGPPGWTIAAIKDRMRWVEDNSVIQTYLEAVAANPEAFVVDAVPRQFIASALDGASVSHPTISDESLAPYLWVETCMARRLLRDNIVAMMQASRAAAWERFEQFQLETVGRDDPPFGHLSIEGEAMMWYWRPGKSPTFISRYGLKEFEDEARVPPEAREYLVHRLPPTRPKGFKGLQLQTMEEAEAFVQPAPGTPRSELSSRIFRQQSESRAADQQPRSLFTQSLGTPSGQGTKHRPVTLDATPQRSGRGSDLNLGSGGGSGEMAGTQLPLGAAAGGFRSMISPTVFGSQQFCGSGIASGGLSGGIDPLAHSLGAAHTSSRARLYSDAFGSAGGQQQRSTRLEGPVFGAPASAPAPPVSTGSQMQFLMVDQTGVSLQQRLNSSLFAARDPHTWRVDPSQRYGPPGFTFLSALTAIMANPVQGQLLQARAPIPADWILRPGAVQFAWAQQFLVPDAKPQDAKFYMKSRLANLGRQGLCLGAAPEPLGPAFFSKAVFDLFRACSRWGTETPKDAETLSESFHPIHWFTLLKDLARPQFPAQGLSRERFQQALINIKYMFHEMTVPEHEAHQRDYSGTQRSSTMLLAGIDRLLQALQHETAREFWPTNPKRATLVAFELFENLFLFITQWIMAHFHSLTLCAEAVPTADAEGPLVLLNPRSTQSANSYTIVDRLNAWVKEVEDRIEFRLPSDPLVNPQTPIREFLFASASEAPSKLPRPSQQPGEPYAPSQQPFMQQQFLYPQYQQPILPPQQQYLPSQVPYVPPEQQQKPAPGKGPPKGEPPVVPGPCATAEKPLLVWSSASKFDYPGRILKKVLRSPGVESPRMRVQRSATSPPVDQPICFNFTCQPTGTAPPQGCDGTMAAQKNAKKRVSCNRVHVDLNDPCWANMDKSAFNSVWKFAQHPAVKEFWSPSEYLSQKMA